MELKQQESVATITQPQKMMGVLPSEVHENSVAYQLDALIQRRRCIFDALYYQEHPLVETKLEEIRKEAQSLILETKALCQTLKHL